MQHISIPKDDAMEFIAATEISPLISKVKIKVCYVGEKPNRNGTVITKEVATEMGRKMLGSPIVGFFNEHEKDFEGHARDIDFTEDGELKLIDLTKPYGFVPTDAKVWFQSFLDDNVEHEYLCTEGYIWTDAYPEAKRITEKGNNQSMELDEKSNGFWSTCDNCGNGIFIYNEALIEKLCILGENVEPCFEGASIQTNFSLAEVLALQKATFSMIEQLQDLLNKGGSQMENEKNVEEFENKSPEETGTETPAPEVEKTPTEETGSPAYNLEEVTEYVELKAQFEELQTNYTALQQEKADLETEINELKEFKAATDKAAKEAMIDSFYMLSDEDKKDVVEHIDEYSIDDIEAKLSIICVRNKVSFNLEKEQNGEEKEEKPDGTFSLEQFEDTDDAPAWIKAVRETANK